MASMSDIIKEGNAKYSDTPLQKFDDKVQSTVKDVSDLGKRLLEKGKKIITGKDVSEGLPNGKP